MSNRGSVDDVIRQINEVVSSWNGPVVVAYSGGKDSSTVLKLVVGAWKKFANLRKDIKIIYCDTGVENPLVSEFVKNTFASLKEELKCLGIDDPVRILKPDIRQRYFVRVIGRGYPPPTQFFRWCTKDLRIRPVQRFLRKLGKDPLVLIGTRSGESAQRDRTFGEVPEGPFIRRQSDGGLSTHLYSPIINFSLDDVWETLVDLEHPRSVNIAELMRIYRDGGGECPVVRETNDRPCSSARFGCWTCTVVRRDRSAEKMVESGHHTLRPYLEFRQWLSELRNNPTMRCKRRRNGSLGLGPLTLSARELIYQKVLALEEIVGVRLLEDAEKAEIRRLWREDQSSMAYCRLEGEGNY